jgi:modulator of FtsH protease HflC
MKKTHSTLLIVAGLSVAMVALGAVFVLPQTHQALVLSFGKPVRVITEPGLAFKVPLIQQVEMFDKRLLDFDADAKEVIAADQKRLIVDAFVRYKIVDPLKFKQSVGDERTMQSRLNTILESTLRQVVGDITLAELISTERTNAMQQVKVMVNDIVSGAQPNTPDGQKVAPRGGFGIEVVDVRIVRADLPQANSESVFKRMQTDREQEAKEFRAKGAEDAQKIRATADKERTILLAEAQKKAEITRGEGDGEAIRIFAEAIGKSPEFYGFYRSLQAYRKSLSQENTTMVLSPNSDFLKYMDKGAGK